MSKEFTFDIKIAEREDVLGVYNALKQNLIEIHDVDKIPKENKQNLENQGFLRKEFDIDYYKHLIEDPNTDIYIAKNNQGKLIGFASVHSKKNNIVKVRDVVGKLSIDDDRTKRLLLDENIEFNYLDQISILPEYKRKGIGTALFKKALINIKAPIVAFIVEKPLFNRASLDWHKYNGFTFSGISEGEYKGKAFKFQILIYWIE
jgi:ribosomal protein S18 acetylase RimI-like enzyme